MLGIGRGRRSRKAKTIKGGDGVIQSRDGWLGRTRRDGTRWTKVPLAHRKAARRRKNSEARESRRRNRGR